MNQTLIQTNDDAFRMAATQKCTLTFQWLLKVSFPSKEELNWEKRKYLLFIASDCKEDNLLYRLPTELSKIVIQFL